MTAPSVHLDFETRSTLDLKKCGLWRYAMDPATEVWCAAFAFGNEEPRLLPNLFTDDAGWHSDDKADLLAHVAQGGRVVAHNAPFELAIWNGIMVPRYGWPVLHPEQTYCTMAMAYAMGLPGALEDAAYALGLRMQKDTVGRALMLRMARPRSYDPLVWWDEPEKVKLLHEYCKQDVRVERELETRLMPLSDSERRVWLTDYAINKRGVAIDIPSVNAACELADTLRDESERNIAELTGGAVTTVNALIPLKLWLSENGLEVDSLAKANLEELLERDDLEPHIRAALLARSEGSKTSTAKFQRMRNMAGDDGRLHNFYQYHGAGPGRWTSRGVQLHNLPREAFSPSEAEDILAMVREGDHRGIDMIYGPPMAVLAKCIRSFFVPQSGYKLVGGDWSNVEGRGQAWFAGENWKLEVFRKADEGKGPGVYEMAYARMFNVPVETVLDPSPERQIGKTAELAFGYQGGAGSWATMAKNYKLPDKTHAEVEFFKKSWRQAHPAIRNCWYEIEAAAVNAVRCPGEVFTCGYMGRQARFRMVGSFLWLQLPSGRVICYPYPRLLPGMYGDQVTYMTVPNPDDQKKHKIIADPMNTGNWARISGYGGSFFNNIVQGFSSDFLRHLLVTAEEAGGTPVLHTHDEAILEVPAARAEKARASLEKLMRTPPPWAEGFPLFAKCKIMDRYHK